MIINTTSGALKGKFDNGLYLFKGIPYGERTLEQSNAIYTDASFGLYVRNTTYTSLTDFKTMLETNNLILYYVLATPTNTEITDANLILQLNSVRLVNGLNNISTVGSDLNPLLNIEAIKYID